MTSPVIVIGAGGHAKVLVDALLTESRTIIGLSDRDLTKTGEFVLGVRVLGDDSVFSDYPPHSVECVNGIGSIGSTEVRRRIFEHFKSRGYRFATVRHPTAIVASSVLLGEGAQIMAGSIIQADSKIGPNAIINSGASIDHDCGIGAHVHVAPGATLSGGVVLGEGVHVGAGSTIIQGIRVGPNCVIGAGAVVLHDLPAGITVAGVPAKELST